MKYFILFILVFSPFSFSMWDSSSEDWRANSPRSSRVDGQSKEVDRKGKKISREFTLGLAYEYFENDFKTLNVYDAQLNDLYKKIDGLKEEFQK